MRCIIVTIITLALWSNVMSQGFQATPRLSLAFGLQKSDLRMPLLPQSIVESILDTANLWSTYHSFVAIQYPLLTRADFSLRVGLGYGRERVEMTRDFMGKYFGNYAGILRLIDHYNIDHLLLPLSFRRRLIKLRGGGFIFGSVDVLTIISFRKAVLAVSNVPGQRGYNPSKFELKPYAMELNPSLGVKLSRWEIAVAYRMYQIRKIDEVLLPKWWLDQPDRRNFPIPGYETHNPFKLWLSLSYDLGPDFSLRGLLRRE